MISGFHFEVEDKGLETVAVFPMKTLVASVDIDERAANALHVSSDAERVASFASLLRQSGLAPNQIVVVGSALRDAGLAIVDAAD